MAALAATAAAARANWASASRSALGSRFFRATYRPAHQPEVNFLKTTPGRSSHVLGEIEERRKFRPRQGLWVSVVAYNSISSKSTVRHYAKRKATFSLRRVFRANGFEPDGLPRDPAIKFSLWGSLRLEVDRRIITATITELDADCEKLLQTINPNR